MVAKWPGTKFTYNYSSIEKDIIPRGTIVPSVTYITPVRCDSIIECFNATDENDCGISTVESLIKGKITVVT